MEQFDSKSSLKARWLFIIERQQNVHRQVSRAFLSLLPNDEASINCKEEKEVGISSESEADDEEMKESIKVAFQQNCYDTSKPPIYQKSLIRRCQSTIQTLYFWRFLTLLVEN